MNQKNKIEKISSIKTLEQCAAMYPAAYNTEPWNDNWTVETATALLTCYFNTPDFIGWVAKQNDKILGCAIGNIEPYYTGSIFVLKEVFVSVDSHRSGVGRSLLAKMKIDLKKMNIKMIILSTRTPIIDFYTKSGFMTMAGVSTMMYSYDNP